MEITLLVKSFVGLVSILFILIFLLLYSAKNKKIAAKKSEKKEKPIVDKSGYESMESLVEIIKNKKSTTQELKVALDKVLQFHGHIHDKLGSRPHPDFNLYAEIIFRICRHPNTNKDLILHFDKELEKNNPAYVKDINDFLSKGLESRGF